MATCTCPAGDLRTVAFSDDIVMRWCARHEVKRWSVAGQEAEHDAVLPALRELFTDERTQRRRRAATAVRRQRPAMQPAPASPVAALTPDEQLTALLRARGVQGSWSIA